MTSRLGLQASNNAEFGDQTVIFKSLLPVHPAIKVFFRSSSWSTEIDDDLHFGVCGNQSNAQEATACPAASAIT